jgi:hypothetical protein
MDTAPKRFPRNCISPSTEAFSSQNGTPCFKTSIKRELEICFTNLFMRYFPMDNNEKETKPRGVAGVVDMSSTRVSIYS